MHRIFLAGLLLLAACAPRTPVAPAPAPTPAAVPTPAPVPVVPADPALWVVKDADTTIYLFGTVHVLKPGLTWFDGAVKTAFDDSETLVLELVMPEGDAAQVTALRAGTAEPGMPPLSQRLAPPARARYLAQLATLGIPAAAFDRFTPWFAANNLVVLPLLRLGYAPDSGAEQVLTRAAKAAGKPVEGLETLEQQLGFFSALSQRAQLHYLTSVIDDLPKLAETIEEMVVHWSRGDPEALARLLNDGVNDTPELSKALLTDRNARWAGWVAKRLDKPGTVFVAVGAGHLAGKESVQAMLAKRGLTASRIRY